MNIRKHFQEALESLTRNMLRTGLTLLGIIIGVAAVVSMLAIGKGAQSSITNSIQSIGTNLIFVSSDSSVKNAQAITLKDAEAIKNTITEDSPYIAVAPSVQVSKTVIYGGESITSTINGVTIDYPTVRNETLSQGLFFTQEQYDQSSSVAVVGADVVTELFSDETIVVGKKIRIGDDLYTIIGVLTSKGGSALGSSDNQILVPLTTAMTRMVTRTRTKGEVNLISISARSADSVEAVTAVITSIIKSRHDITSDGDNDFTVFTQESFTEAASSIASVLTLFLGGIAAISLLVGGIGIMNIMLVSVIERTREIGLRKALGARDRDILTQFLIESLIIGLMGGLLGVVCGWGITVIIKTLAASGSTSLNPVITLDVVFLATMFSVLVGLIFGLYPANRASKLEPVEALRSE